MKPALSAQSTVASRSSAGGGGQCKALQARQKAPGWSQAASSRAAHGSPRRSQQFVSPGASVRDARVDAAASGGRSGLSPWGPPATAFTAGCDDDTLTGRWKPSAEFPTSYPWGGPNEAGEGGEGGGASKLPVKQTLHWSQATRMRAGHCLHHQSRPLLGPGFASQHLCLDARKNTYGPTNVHSGTGTQIRPAYTS